MTHGSTQGVALNSNGLEDSSPIEVDSDNQSKHMNFKVFENPSPVVKVCQLTAASSQFMAAGNAMTNINLDNPFWRGLISLFLPVANKFFDLGIQGRGAINYLEPGELHYIENSCFFTKCLYNVENYDLKQAFLLRTLK